PPRGPRPLSEEAPPIERDSESQVTMRLVASPAPDPAVADGDGPAHLPPLIAIGDELAPKAPTGPSDTGLSPAVLRDLALKAAYTAMIEWQLARAPEVTREHVAASLAELVLTEEDTLLAGLAATSGRSLLVYGPPGNGKTSLGRMLNDALQGDLWIPHCIGIEE